MDKKMMVISILLYLLFLPLPAFAADSETQTTFSVTPGEGENEILDPEIPSNPVQPIEPIHPGGGGPLTIDYASQWQFSSQKISGQDKSYFAQLDQMEGGQETAPFIQVTDKRGTFSGWKLSLTQTTPFQTEAGRILNGAELSLKNMQLNSPILDREDGGEYQPTTPQSAILLNVGEKQILIDAQAERGIGTWSLRFGTAATDAKNSVELKVPGKTVKLAQAYTTKIVWTLENTPSNGGNEE